MLRDGCARSRGLARRASPVKRREGFAVPAPHARRGRISYADRHVRSSASRYVKRKLVEFAPELWLALEMLARKTTGTSFQELADEAFGDLLGKYQRPATLKDALGRARAASPPMTIRRPTADAAAPRLALGHIRG